MGIEAFGKSMSKEEFARELRKRQAEVEKGHRQKMMDIKVAARGYGKSSSMMDEMTELQHKYDQQMYHYHQLMAKAKSNMDSILGILPPPPVVMPLETHKFTWLDMGDDKKELPDSITSKEELPISEAIKRYGTGGLLEQIEGQKQEYEKLTMKHLEKVIEDLSSTRKKFPMTPAEAMGKAFGTWEPSVSPILGVNLPEMDDVALDQLHKGVMEEIDIPTEEKSILLTHIAAERARRITPKTRRGKKKPGGFLVDEDMLNAEEGFRNKMEMDMLFGTREQPLTLHTGAEGLKAFNDAMKGVHHMSTKGIQMHNPATVFHMEHKPDGYSVGDEDRRKTIEVEVKSSTPVVPNLGGSLRQTRVKKVYEKLRKSRNSGENRYEL